MLGWKPVERTIATDLLLDEAVEKATEIGFVISSQNPGFSLLRRKGAWWATKVESLGAQDSKRATIPLELGIAEGENGLFFQLRYGTFVAFDTGDLERFADELVNVFAGTHYG